MLHFSRVRVVYVVRLMISDALFRFLYVMVAFRAGSRRVPRARLSSRQRFFCTCTCSPRFLRLVLLHIFSALCLLRLANYFSMYHVCAPGLDRAAILLHFSN